MAALILEILDHNDALSAQSLQINRRKLCPSVKNKRGPFRHSGYSGDVGVLLMEG
jgi:hypothetical protein